MYYLGRNFEDKFLSVKIKLGYPILIQKMDLISAATMWHESIITNKSQRIILQYLTISFSKRLIVPEYCITELGQNLVPLESDSVTLNDKKIHF